MGKKSMEMKYIIFLLITICWILGTIGLTYNMEVPQGSSKNLELFRLIFLSIGAYGVITATYFTVQNSLESTQNVKAKIDFDKTQNSIRFIERFDEPSLKESRDFTRKIIKNREHISDKKLLEDIKADPDLERSIITNFNFWEGMYFAIIHGNVNEDFLKRAFKDNYTLMYKRFEIWIDSMKNEYPEFAESLKLFNNRWLL